MSGCSSCGEVKVYPPYKNLCNGDAYQLVAGDTLCDFNVVVCKDGSESQLSGEDFFALIAQSLNITLGDQEVNFTITEACKAVADLTHQQVSIVDSEGNPIEINVDGEFVLPEVPAIPTLQTFGGIEIELDANNTWTLPEDVDAQIPTLSDSDGNVIPLDANNNWTLPEDVDAEIPTLTDSNGNLIPLDGNNNWTLPSPPDILDSEGNVITFNSATNEWTLPAPTCLVDEEGNPIPQDANECYIIGCECCIKDADGNDLLMDADGCFLLPANTDPVCGPLGFVNPNVELAVGSPQTIDLNSVFSLNAADTGTLTFAVDQASADGIQVISITNGNLLQIQSNQTSCTWSIEVTPSCVNPDTNVSTPYSTQTITGTHVAGTEIFGPSLMDATAFDSAVEGPVTAGNEFAPGWSNPTLDYRFNDYPPDTSIAIMEGDYDGAVGDFVPPIDGRRFAAQVAFPGDPNFGIPARSRWFYGNGNNTGAPYIIAEYAVTGIVPGTTYELVAYTSNAIRPESTFGDAPQTQFRIDGVPVGSNILVPYHSSAHAGVDVWERHTRRWTAPAGVTTATFSIYDAAIGVNGDDFAVVIEGMQEVEVC